MNRVDIAPQKDDTLFRIILGAQYLRHLFSDLEFDRTVVKTRWKRK